MLVLEGGAMPVLAILTILTATAPAAAVISSKLEHDAPQVGWTESYTPPPKTMINAPRSVVIECTGEPDRIKGMGPAQILSYNGPLCQADVYLKSGYVAGIHFKDEGSCPALVGCR